MTKLDSSDSVWLFYESDETRERLHKSVVPNAEIADGAAAAPLDLCRFDDDQARAAGREFSRIHQMPVGRKSLHRGILVHRRYHDAVAQFDVPDGQRGKQQHFRHLPFPRSAPGLKIPASRFRSDTATIYGAPRRGKAGILRGSL